MRRALTILGLVTAVALSLGIAVLASAGSARGVALYGDSFYFVKHQAVWLVAALVAAAVAYAIDYHFWRTHYRVTAVAFGVMLVLLAAVFAFPQVNGSWRWIRIGSSLRVQPSELAKLMTVFAIAVWLDRAGFRVNRFVRGALAPALIIAAPAGLLIKEPDYGATLVVASVGGTLMLLAGVRKRFLALLGGAGFAIIAAYVYASANRMARITAWLNGSEGGADSESTREALYQLTQAITAIGQGGLFGVGYNHSMQKQYYLPEAHTDFIFAIGAEELGLIFSLVVLGLFIAIFVCGLYVSMHATDRLGRLLAFGMTYLIVVQAVVNIGVVTGCLPTKGLALPLISYGGTNLISALVAVATIMNVGVRTLVAEQKLRPRAVPISN